MCYRRARLSFPAPHVAHSLIPPATHLPPFITAATRPPRRSKVSSVVAISANVYTGEQVRAYEGAMLAALKWGVNAPTVHTFLPRCLAGHAEALAAAPGGAAALAAATAALPVPANPAYTHTVSSRLAHLACYLLELAAMEYDALKTPRSALAAAAASIAARTLLGAGAVEGDHAVALLTAASGYTPAQLAPVVAAMEAIALGSSTVMPQLQAVRKKYSHDKFGAVATLPLATVYVVPAAAAAKVPSPLLPRGGGGGSGGSSGGDAAGSDGASTASASSPASAASLT